MPEFVRVSTLSEIPSGKGKVIRVEGREIALFKCEDSVYAVDNLCPHEGGPLGHGIVREGVVTCPWHLWRFNVRTGAMIEAPEMKVDCFQVKVEREEVSVDVSSLVAPLRKSRLLLRRFAEGETIEALAAEYRMSPEEVEREIRQVRIGERLVWLGELFQRQGAICSQDLLNLPYRDLEGISYGAQEKLDELIDLL